MSPSEQNKLLSEILAGEEVTKLRETSLEQGLDALRRRRRLRLFARVGTMAMMPLALVLALCLKEFNRPASHQRPSEEPQYASTPVPGPVAAVKFVTDEELLALFPNRAVALVGKPGHQQLVLLGGPVNRPH